MSTATAPALVTAEELLAMPENGVDRWLIRGKVKEKPMTVRNRFHSRGHGAASSVEKLALFCGGAPTRLSVWTLCTSQRTSLDE